MKFKEFILFVMACVIGSPSLMAQQWAIEAEPVCWSYNGVDSSLNRYVLISARSNQSRTLFYHDAYENIVDVSAGGTLTFGYCDTLCGISEVRIDTFRLNGTELELALNGGEIQSVDLAGLGVVSSPPILGQSSEPVNIRVFWKDTDGDTLRVKAPYGDQGFKDLAYHHEVRSSIDSLRKAVIFQGKAILDTIPILAGIDQSRLDSMHVIGVTSTASGWQASTAARDTLYPDAFAFQIHNTDSLIIAYSGILVFPDSVFQKGKNYYQPYDYIKYQEEADTTLEQLVFKALDTNIIEIRDRYSYLAEGKTQSSRDIPVYDVTYTEFTDDTLAIAYVPVEDYLTLTGTRVDSFIDPISAVVFQNTDPNDRPIYNSSGYFTHGGARGLWNATGSTGLSDEFTVIMKIRPDNSSTGNRALFSKHNEGNNGFYWSTTIGPNKIYVRVGPSASLTSDVTSITLDSGVDYILAARYNPSTGVYIRAYNLTTLTYQTDQGPSYTSEGNWDNIVLGAREQSRDHWSNRIYGMYFFKNSLSNQEMIDLIENWDVWHTKL